MSKDQWWAKSEDGTALNREGVKRRDLLLSGTSLVVASALTGAGFATPVQAQQPAPTQPTGKQPNIVIIWGDDIGISDVSAYSHGLMGFKTPNIDRIAERSI